MQTSLPSLRACQKGESAGYLQCNPVSGSVRMVETCLGVGFNKTLRIVLFPGGYCVLLVHLSVSIVLGVKGKALLLFDCRVKCA